MKCSPLTYSLHALGVMEERQIPADWVERTIARPRLTMLDPADPDLEHALLPIPEREGRVLRVVYNRSTEPVKVVTAFFDRTMRGKL